MLWRGWAHTELIPGNGDDARRIPKHADLDLEVAALQGELAERTLLLAERDGHLDALGVYGNVCCRSQGQPQHNQTYQPRPKSAPAIARFDDGLPE